MVYGKIIKDGEIMKIEYSCGAVVYTVINGKRKYVIITNMKGIYGFPKGHIEKGETENQTALREIKEETNLDVNLLDDFKESETIIKDEQRIKHITYFLASYNDQKIKPKEDEVSSIKLMSYDEAINLFQFDSRREVLKKAEDFLNNKK